VKSAEEISDVRMFVAGKNGHPDMTVKLGDIAKITDTVAEPDRLSRMNGKPVSR